MGTYPLDPKGQLILIPVTVIGPRKPHAARMILDTGASYTMVDPDILVDVGYDLAQAPESRPITTASGTEYCSFIKIKALTALGYTMKGVEICVHSLPPNLPVRGLLGLNFLRHFNLHLRFLDQILEISK